MRIHATRVSTLLLIATAAQAPADDAALQQALERVEARCPQEYPATVTAIPESTDIATMATADLFKLLESWNPSLRAKAAKALGDRGAKEVPVLRKATQSENWMVRAGAAEALAAITGAQVKAGSDPADFRDVAGDFIRLTGDPRLEVRIAALGGLSKFAPQTADAARAVLNLCADDDVYLAQDAMITFDKQFTTELLQQDEVISAMQQTFELPLPRGKGHIIRQIQKMDERAQRKFIPQLLGHLDWKPMRDTMFGSSGQEDSLKLLTKLKVKELIPRLPKLMGKDMRGPRLFEPCLDSAAAFGKDARPILPELKAILDDLDENGDKAAIVPRGDLEAIITKFRGIIAKIEN